MTGVTSGVVEWSTTSVEDSEAFGYWRDMICDESVQLSARPRSPEPVAVVAARSGFPGPAQLHRAFRRELGATPGEARMGTPPGTDRQS